MAQNDARILRSRPFARRFFLLDALHREVVKAMQAPDFKERLASEGAEPVGSAPAEFAEYMKKDVAKWAAVSKRAAAKVD